MSILTTREWFASKDEANMVMVNVALALTEAGLGSKFGVRVKAFGEGYQVLVIKRNVV